MRFFRVPGLWVRVSAEGSIGRAFGSWLGLGLSRLGFGVSG